MLKRPLLYLIRTKIRHYFSHENLNIKFSTILFRKSRSWSASLRGTGRPLWWSSTTAAPSPPSAITNRAKTPASPHPPIWRPVSTLPSFTRQLLSQILDYSFFFKFNDSIRSQEIINKVRVRLRQSVDHGGKAILWFRSWIITIVQNIRCLNLNHKQFWGPLDMSLGEICEYTRIPKSVLFLFNHSNTQARFSQAAYKIYFAFSFKDDRIGILCLCRLNYHTSSDFRPQSPLSKLVSHLGFYLSYFVKYWQN